MANKFDQLAIGTGFNASQDDKFDKPAIGTGLNTAQVNKFDKLSIENWIQCISG